ncbi:hypothetical protein BT69DRAFT_55366 [Atractiella rhizophila]|nr:hypothetical protein BT69DRAFT_55366 [Atractiella rhizophila]
MLGFSNFKRSTTAHSSKLTVFGGSRSVEWFKEGNYTVLRETIKCSAWGEKDKHNPPYHLHKFQHETFRIVRGTAGFKLNGQKMTKTEQDGEIVIPAMARHTFWNDSPEEDMVVDIWVDPEENGFDERFLRNLYSYFQDCEQSIVQPSLFQVLLFLHSADVLLADPPLWIAKGMNVVVGVLIGEWLLGYRRTYPEYYDAKLKND